MSLRRISNFIFSRVVGNKFFRALSHLLVVVGAGYLVYEHVSGTHDGFSWMIALIMMTMGSIGVAMQLWPKLVGTRTAAVAEVKTFDLELIQAKLKGVWKLSYIGNCDGHDGYKFAKIENNIVTFSGEGCESTSKSIILRCTSANEIFCDSIGARVSGDFESAFELAVDAGYLIKFERTDEVVPSALSASELTLQNLLNESV